MAWTPSQSSNYREVDSFVPEYSRPENPYEYGTKSYQLYENNPFVESTNVRSPWETFGNMLGIKTAYDKAEIDRINQLKAYDAQIAQVDAEDKYNSPEQQLQRAKEAGLNPNVTGSALNSTEGSEFDMSSPEFQSIQQYQSDQNKLPDFIQGVMSAIANGVNIANALQSGRTSQLANISHAMKIGSDAGSESHLDPEKLASIVEALRNGESISNLLSDALDEPLSSFMQQLSRMPLSKKEKNIASNAFVRKFDTSFIGREIESISDLLDLYSETKVSRKTNPFAVDSNGYFVNSTKKLTDSLFNKLSDLALQSFTHDQATKSAISKFNFAYWKSRNGGNQAQFEEARIEADKLIREGDAKLNECFKDIITSLYGVTKSNKYNALEKDLAKGSLLALFGMRNNLMPNLPLPSFSRDVSEDKFGKRRSSFKFRLSK